GSEARHGLHAPAGDRPRGDLGARTVRQVDREAGFTGAKRAGLEDGDAPETVAIAVTVTIAVAVTVTIAVAVTVAVAQDCHRVRCGGAVGRRLRSHGRLVGNLAAGFPGGPHLDLNGGLAGAGAGHGVIAEDRVRSVAAEGQGVALYGGYGQDLEAVRDVVRNVEDDVIAVEIPADVQAPREALPHGDAAGRWGVVGLDKRDVADAVGRRSA